MIPFLIKLDDDDDDEPREVFAFKRGNSENFLPDLANECENFLSSIISYMPSVEQMRVLLKK